MPSATAVALTLAMCPGFSQIQDPKSHEWVTTSVQNFHPNLAQMDCEDARDARTACHNAYDLWKDALSCEQTVLEVLAEKKGLELKLQARTPQVTEAFKAPAIVETETPGWVWPVVGVLVGAAAIGGFTAGYFVFGK